MREEAGELQERDLTPLRPGTGERIRDETPVARPRSARDGRGGAVLARIGEERRGRPGREVRRAEGVEAMLHDDAVLARTPLPVLRGERCVDVVEQFADDDARRDRPVVALALADVAEMQPVAGAHQRLEEQVPVVVAGRTVAQHRTRRHQVEAEVRRLPRERAVVHAQQADDAERDAPHRLQRAEGDAAGEEARAR